MNEELLERVKRKDRKSQKEFYQQFSEQMFRLVYRYVCNEQDAGSIVNMGFYKIFEHVNEFTYQCEKSTLSWMKRIVINEALMFLRKRIIYEELKDNEAENLTAKSFPEENLMLEDYYRLIRSLPNDLRTVFNLYAIDGFSHKEIAGQLNIKEASSRVYLTRARKILQDFITKKPMHNGKG